MMKVLLCSLLFFCVVSCISDKVCNVLDFGAKGDGKTKDTPAIVSAINAIAAASGGVLYFPGGYSFLTGPFNLTSNIVVLIETNATILGQGQMWWTMHQKNQLNYTRGRLIELMYADGIFINHVTLINSPFWTVHPYSSNNVVITDIVIDNPSDSPNTDGIDPDSCSNVYIARCNISDGDDCIAIKSGIDYCGRMYNKSSENILIEDCIFGSGHGISLGSEMSGGIRNVTVRNCIANGTENGARIKTQRGRGGIVEDILFQNITVLNLVDDGIVINMFYSTLPPTNASATPIFRNIAIVDYMGSALKAAGDFECLPESPCTGITLQNVYLKSKDGSTCENVNGTTTNVNPSICF